MSKKTFLSDIDLNHNQLIFPVLQNIGSDPLSADSSLGQFFINTTSNKAKYYDGTKWRQFGLDLNELGGEPKITVGTATTYWRGDKTFQTLNTAAVPELTNLYYTAARVNALNNTYTGDVTSSGTVNTLKTVNSNVGAFGNATTIPIFTVNAKGLITAASHTAIGILNQNTTGSAGSLLNSRTIWGQSFNGTANVSGALSGATTGSFSGAVTIGGNTSTKGLSITNGTKTVNITVDANGSLVIDNVLISTEDVIAFGAAGSTGGSGGSGLIAQVFGLSGLGSTYLDSDLTSTFNAYTINVLNNKITALEGGSATSLNVTGTGNVITNIAKSGSVITVTKGSTFSVSGHKHTKADITDFPTALSSFTNDTNFSTVSYVNTKISDLVGSSPETLDTLNELAIALGNDPNFATTIAGQIGGKANTVHTHTKSQITDFPTKLSEFTNNLGNYGGFLTANQSITVSGDATGTGATSIALTLKTVNSNVGSFGGSTAIPVLAVNAKGLVTAVSTVAVIAPAGTLSGTTLNAGVKNSSLTSVGTITTGVWNATAIAVAKGGTGHTSGYMARKATGTITGGLNTFSVVHGFTKGVIAQVWETTTGTVVEVDTVTSPDGTTKFNFNIAPTSGVYSYTIIG